MENEEIGRETDSDGSVTDLTQRIKGKSDKHRRRIPGIYLLPNLITTGALFAGFYSIISSMNGAIEKAAIAICVAGVLDAMDGRIARLTNTQSEFGVQYDSLSDLVAFGVAPAVLLFSWTLSELNNLGWMMAFLYMACAALRLARFNTHPESTSFTGLASPGSAGTVAAMVWLFCDLGYEQVVLSIHYSLLIGVVTTGFALLMVSNITYYSPKGINLKGRVPFIYMLAIIMLFVVIFIYPPGVLMGIGVIYALSGPIQALQRRRSHSTSEPEP
jgi:CDP-diacylglycerol--serine O-phosphatidyltransferase